MDHNQSFVCGMDMLENESKESAFVDRKFSVQRTLLVKKIGTFCPNKRKWFCAKLALQTMFCYNNVEHKKHRRFQTVQEAQALSDCTRSTGAFRLFKKHRRFQTVQEAQALSDCTRSTGAFRRFGSFLNQTRWRIHVANRLRIWKWLVVCRQFSHYPCTSCKVCVWFCLTLTQDKIRKRWKFLFGWTFILKRFDRIISRRNLWRAWRHQCAHQSKNEKAGNKVFAELHGGFISFKITDYLIPLLPTSPELMCNNKLVPKQGPNHDIRTRELTKCTMWLEPLHFLMCVDASLDILLCCRGLLFRFQTNVSFVNSHSTRQHVSDCFETFIENLNVTCSLSKVR